MSTLKVSPTQEQVIPPPAPPKHIVVMSKEIMSMFGIARLQLDVDFAVGRVDVKVTDVDGNTLVIGVSHERASVLVATPTGARHEYLTGLDAMSTLALVGLFMPQSILLRLVQSYLAGTPTSLRLTDFFQVRRPEDIVDVIKAAITPFTK